MEDIKNFKEGFILVLKVCGFMLVSAIVMVLTVCLGWKVIALILKLFGLL